MDLSALQDVLSQSGPGPEAAPRASAPVASGMAAVLLDCADSGEDEEGGAPAPPPRRRDGTQLAPARLLLRVTHHPVVALRAAPSLDAPLLGFARRDEVLCADARRGVWARLHNGVHPPPARDANHLWVLLLHSQLGRLLAPLDGGAVGDLPEAPPEALPDPSAAAACEPHPDAPLRRRAATLRVAAELVYVRAEASLRARQLGYRRRGAACETDAERGDWVRLAPPEEGWVLRVHPSLGVLLE